jgi:hypothetical protein
MRFLLALIAVLGIGIATSVSPLPLEVADNVSAVVSAQQPAIPDVDVEVGGDAWWSSGWVIIGAVAVVFLVLVVALAGRGGGTTIIKD